MSNITSVEKIEEKTKNLEYNLLKIFEIFNRNMNHFAVFERRFVIDKTAVVKLDYYITKVSEIFNYVTILYHDYYKIDKNYYNEYCLKYVNLIAEGYAYFQAYCELFNIMTHIEKVISNKKAENLIMFINIEGKQAVINVVNIFLAVLKSNINDKSFLKLVDRFLYVIINGQISVNNFQTKNK